MLLFKKVFFEGIVSGAVTVTFRRWERARVRVGGRYRCHPIGVLEVDDVRTVRVGAIGPDDAARAGFATREALLAYMAEHAGGELDEATEVHRVAFRHGGDGDRVQAALVDTLTADDVAQIKAALARLDRPRRWTARTLALIEASPRVAASKLAAKLERETEPFKIDVRKLKKLGLTQSFEVGYEIAPRGRAYLEAAARAKRPKRGILTP